MQCEVEGREKKRVATVTELERISSECQQKEDELNVVKEQLTVVYLLLCFLFIDHYIHNYKTILNCFEIVQSRLFHLVVI